ncbi:MAG: ElyC/SanA/YdcF family protein [Steroidobacteraceae bacterium]
MLYLLKECIGALTAPLSLGLWLTVAAGILGWGGRKRAAVVFLAAACIVVYGASTGVVGDWLLTPLERQYPSLRDQSLAQAHWIVVLGSSYTPQDGQPVTAAIDSDGLVRIVEGVRLMHINTAAKLLVSGGAPDGMPRPAQGYAVLARDLGIDPRSLVVSDQPLDSNEEARDVVKLLGAEPFILVTSAYHMPRAMRLMRRAGARPIAAPTGQLVNTAPGRWRRFLPSSAGLGKSERALHEYLGFAAMAIGVN